MSIRKRRSPEEARQEILAAAQDRLRLFGIDGLNVVDVAKACGMSHATVLHHFGSTGGMRHALVTYMTAQLLEDIIASLQQNPSLEPSQVLHSLFHTLSAGGHAKLLAWVSLAGNEMAPQEAPGALLQHHFNALIPVIAGRLPPSPRREEHARRVVFLIAAAAIGSGVGGNLLATVIGLPQAEVDHFPDWLGQQIYHMVSKDD